MKAFMKKVWRILKGFIKKLNDDHIPEYAAHSAYFIFISAFPLAMLLFSVIRYTPVSESFLIETIERIAPGAVLPLANSLITEMYEQSSGAVISVTALLTLWTASKGVLAIENGLNNVFGIKEKRNYFISRIISSVYTIFFVLGIVLVLVMMVFGNALLRMIETHAPIIYEVVEWIIDKRILYVPLILTLVFVGLYHLVGNYKRPKEKRMSFLQMIPGAFCAAVGWMGFSFFYSIYVDNYAGKSYMYGSLTIIVLLMLWMYICIYILFIGGEINQYFNIYIDKIREKKIAAIREAMDDIREKKTETIKK